MQVVSHVWWRLDQWQQGKPLAAVLNQCCSALSASGQLLPLWAMASVHSAIEQIRAYELHEGPSVALQWVAHSALGPNFQCSAAPRPLMGNDIIHATHRVEK